MSRVEEDSFSSENSIKGSSVSKLRMKAHIARREPGRMTVEDEIEKLMEGIIVLEEGIIREREDPRRAQKTEIVASYPIGWTKIKRY